MNSYFPEEDIVLTNKYRKICSASLAVREMQIQTTGTYSCKPIRMAKMKNCDNAKCCQGYRN